MCRKCGLNLSPAFVDMVQTRLRARDFVTVHDEGRVYAHTVGLTRRGWPEILVAMQGLPVEAACEMVRGAAWALLAEGVLPVPGLKIPIGSESGSTAGIVLRTFPRPEELSVLLRLYGEDQYSVLEIRHDWEVPIVLASALQE